MVWYSSISSGLESKARLVFEWGTTKENSAEEDNSKAPLLLIFLGNPLLVSP